MNEPSAPVQGTSGEWAPYDYSDGRRPGDWKSIYPKEARFQITCETLYLIAWSALYLIGVYWLLYELYWRTDSENIFLNKDAALTSQRHTFLGFIAAWIGGSLGGFGFGIKWMYHSVAKQIWHEDRRLWRLLTPHLSGIVSLFMMFLVSSELLRVFDKDFVTRPVAVLAFSFLVGYFSDKALAKMAEVADTLFGASKSDKAPDDKPEHKAKANNVSNS